MAKTAGGTTRLKVEPALPTIDHYINVLHILFCIVFAGRSCMLIDPPTLPDHVTSYDQWACAQTSQALPCGNAVGQCNAVRSNLSHRTSQHDGNVVRKHQGIVKSVTGFPKASRHLLKRQSNKLKRHGAATLWGKPWTVGPYYIYRTPICRADGLNTALNWILDRSSSKCWPRPIYKAVANCTWLFMM